MAYDLIDRVLAERRREAEKERQRVLRRAGEALDLVAEKHPLEEAFLFGSVTKAGRFRADSDIDIALPEVSAVDYFRIWEELERTVRRSIDLVLLHEVSFRKKIEREGILWKKRAIKPCVRM